MKILKYFANAYFVYIFNDLVNYYKLGYNFLTIDKPIMVFNLQFSLEVKGPVSDVELMQDFFLLNGDAFADKTMKEVHSVR